jgi:hypothetical protein
MIGEGFPDDSIAWNQAISLYDADQVVEASALARQLSVGAWGEYIAWWRTIEAEAQTRKAAVAIPITDWASLEFVEDEFESLREERVRSLLEVCDTTARALNWEHRAETRFTVLLEASYSDFATHPEGYMAEKDPYYKICLPMYVCEDPEEFASAVAHEYAHVISTEVADGRADRWLEEGISVWQEADANEEVLQMFREKSADWHTTESLEQLLEGGGAFIETDEEELDLVYVAYQQAGVVVRHIANRYGEAKIAEILAAHLRADLGESLGLRTPTESALLHVTGAGAQAHFSTAYQRLIQSE